MSQPEDGKNVSLKDEKEDLKRKLKEKMLSKRINRMGKSQQRSIMNKHLEKAGIDPAIFEKMMQQQKK